MDGEEAMNIKLHAYREAIGGVGKRAECAKAGNKSGKSMNVNILWRKGSSGTWRTDP